MTDIYLTKEKKQEYMFDFENNVLTYNEIEKWKLDDRLASILSSINNNPHIQSLYSKRSSFIKPENNPKSYLKFCYTHDVELNIFREIIPILIFDFNNGFTSKCYYDFSLPRENTNFSKDSNHFGLNCIDDQNYFLINTIRLTLESDNKQMHENFWIKINELLSKL